jgi:hypothetical protein
VARFRRRALLPSPSCARLERMRLSRRSAPRSASRGGPLTSRCRDANSGALGRLRRAEGPARALRLRWRLSGR